MIANYLGHQATVTGKSLGHPEKDEENEKEEDGGEYADVHVNRQ